MITLEIIRDLLSELPGIEKGFSYGTRAFKVKGKLIARMHQKEDAVVVKVDLNQREQLIRSNPMTYYITDHYLNHPWILVRLATAHPGELGDLLQKAWRLAATKSLIAEYEADG